MQIRNTVFLLALLGFTPAMAADAPDRKSTRLNSSHH